MFIFCTFQIKDLNLDNCRATQIEGLTDEFKNLESLSLINVGLTTLKGFPSLPSLRKVSVFAFGCVWKMNTVTVFMKSFFAYRSFW